MQYRNHIALIIIRLKIILDNFKLINRKINQQISNSEQKSNPSDQSDGSDESDLYKKKRDSFPSPFVKVAITYSSAFAVPSA